MPFFPSLKANIFYLRLRQYVITNDLNYLSTIQGAIRQDPHMFFNERDNNNFSLFQHMLYLPFAFPSNMTPLLALNLLRTIAQAGYNPLLLTIHQNRIPETQRCFLTLALNFRTRTLSEEELLHFLTHNNPLNWIEFYAKAEMLKLYINYFSDVFCEQHARSLLSLEAKKDKNARASIRHLQEIDENPVYWSLVELASDNQNIQKESLASIKESALSSTPSTTWGIKDKWVFSHGLFAEPRDNSISVAEARVLTKHEEQALIPQFLR